MQLFSFIILALSPLPCHAWRIQSQEQLLRTPSHVSEMAAQEYHQRPDWHGSLFQALASAQSGGNVAEGLDNVAFIFSVAAIAYFVYMIVLRNPKLDELYAEKDEEMGKLLGNYNTMVNDMEESLKHMMDMQIEWTERVLNDQRKDFVRFLNYVKDQKDFFGKPTPELLKHFRGFVVRWLTVYQQCSKHPIEKPNLVVSDEELNRCKSVKEISELVGTRLANAKMHFLMIGESSAAGKGWGNPFSRKQRRRKGPPAALEEDQMPDADGGCSWINVCGMNRNFFLIEQPDEDGWPFTVGMSCCGMTFLTPMHLSIVLALIFGLLLLAVEILCQRFASILLFTGICSLLVILARFEKIDDLARLELEFSSLKDDNDDIETHHKEVTEFYERLGDFADIWCNRTTPCLRLLKEVALKLEDECQGDADLAVQLCNATEKGMDMLDRCAGPLQFWMGLDCDDGLKSLRKGIEACADFVERNEVKAILAQRETIFGVVRMVRVRVECCNHLPRYSMINKIDPYVRVRIGDAKWAQTKTIANKQSPKWAEKGDPDFNFKPRSMTAKLEVQVMHDSTVVDDKAVCKADIDLSNVAPGKWQRIKEPLKDTEKSDVEVSVFVCLTLEHLNMLTPAARRKATEGLDKSATHTPSIKSNGSSDGMPKAGSAGSLAGSAASSA